MDVFAKITELRKRLSDDGCGSFSEEIKDLVDSGSTGSEILMSVRWKLSEGLKANVIPEALRKEVKQIIKDLDKALNG